MLRESTQGTAQNATEETEDEAVQDRIITCFGMFWRRDLVQWSRKPPRVLGAEQPASEPVDLYEQQGIYLLYDGREVIYAGRTVRPLGLRLYEHTIDRLATRWDRFSWFGLRPVLDSGALGLMPATYRAELLIPAFEALVIEALEPRQNRRRGDDLGAVEYLQREDPDLEAQRAKAMFDSMIARAQIGR